jgi:AraC-like DNA-binding protein
VVGYPGVNDVIFINIRLIVMPKPKLILYGRELSTCTCYYRIFNHEAELFVTGTAKEFLRKIGEINFDIAVLCFCFAEEKDVEELSRLEALSGPLPVLACSKSYNPNFIRLAAQRGVNHFLLCDMEVNKIRQFILTALRGSGLRSFMEFCCPGCLASSPYVGKMINEIVHAFPHRLTIKELSRRLGITARRLQMVCQQAFGKTFTHLMRRIWVYQALKMMQNTNLDNTEISFQLNYSDETSLARIFRKELGYSPTEARKRLNKYSPEELLMKKNLGVVQHSG